MADTGRPPGLRRARVPAALVSILMAGLMAGGCATVPTAGPPLSAPVPEAGGGGGSNCCGLEVSGPHPGMSASDVVSGFLLASAVFADHHEVAREYLAPSLRKSWSPRAPVTILETAPKLHRTPARLVGGQAGSQHVTVTVTGQKVATLEPSGQYIPVGRNGAAPSEQTFSLGTVGGQLLITSLPSRNELVLTRSLFTAVYQPRNLYYYGLRGNAPVPDPVFVPQDSTNPVRRLVGQLFDAPNGLPLEGAAVTSFPSDARLEKVQVLPGLSEGKTAIINIKVPRGTSQVAEQAMAEQVVLTLTDPAYRQPALAQAVELKFNGRSWSPGPGAAPVLTLSSYASVLPQVSNDSSLYSVTSSGGVQVLGPRAPHSSAVPGPAGTGEIPLREIAISPGDRYLAGIGGPHDKLYTADLFAAAKHEPAGNLHARLPSAQVTAIGWDGSDRLWVAARTQGVGQLWMLPGGKGKAAMVAIVPRLGPITGLRVSPDGVRVALIVGKGKASRLLLAAIMPTSGGYSIKHTVPLGGKGLSGVTAITWFGENHLLAITKEGSRAQLWSVPVNGDQPTVIHGPSSMVAVTADGPHNPLYIALSSGRLEKAAGVGEQWTDSGPGQAPAYPG